MTLHWVEPTRGICSFGVLHGVVDASSGSSIASAYAPDMVSRSLNVVIAPTERRDRADNERPADHEETPGEALGLRVDV